MRTFTCLAALALAFSLGLDVLAAPAKADANEDRAMAMVEQAVQHEKNYGSAKAFADFNDPAGAFVQGEVYVFAFDFAGKCLAHGADPKLIGTNMLDVKDGNGKAMIKEMAELAKTHKNGWVDYLFKNPKSGKVELKTAYVQKVGDHFIGSGTYRDPAAAAQQK